MKDTLTEIVERCHRIKNSRTETSILNHAMGEIGELYNEIQQELHGFEPGPDGVLGEAIDIFLCAIDHAVMQRGVTAEDVRIFIFEKLDKWERLYGNA